MFFTSSWGKSAGTKKTDFIKPSKSDYPTSEQLLSSPLGELLSTGPPDKRLPADDTAFPVSHTVDTSAPADQPGDTSDGRKFENCISAIEADVPALEGRISAVREVTGALDGVVSTIETDTILIQEIKVIMSSIKTDIETSVGRISTAESKLQDLDPAIASINEKLDTQVQANSDLQTSNNEQTDTNTKQLTKNKIF